MNSLIIAAGAGVLYVIAYYTYGRFLGNKIFKLTKENICPSVELQDGVDFVPSRKEVLFGHHFASIAGTGPIVGPALAVIWGWLPALIWVVVGSIFMGAVHDFGALIISLRNQGRSIGDIAGDLISKRVKLLFLMIICPVFTDSRGDFRSGYRFVFQYFSGIRLAGLAADSNSCGFGNIDLQKKLETRRCSA